MARRLVLAQLLLTILVLVITEVPFGLTYAARARDDLVNRIERDAAVLAAYAEDVLTGTQTGDLAAVATGYQRRTGGRLVIVDATGTALVDSDPPEAGTRTFATRPEFAQALRGESSSGRRRSETLQTGLVYVATPIASGNTVVGALRITHPTAAMDARVRRVWFALGGVAVSTLIAAGVMAASLARSVTRPISEVQRAADRFGSGDQSARAPVDDGPPEVRVLATSFNAMAQRIGELIQTQEGFVSDASHQLRTPLTALRLRLEVIAQRVELGTAVSAEDLNVAMADVRRMSRLVDGLLALASAERLEPTPAATVDVPSLLRERQTVWSALAEDEGVAVTLTDEAGTDGIARASEDRLSQVLDNLIANAVEATPPQRGVRLSWARTLDDQIEIHVIDDGPGLSDEERDRAFDRFWRASPEAGTFGGSGLGLAIARQLTVADGGRLELRAAAGGGVDAVITLGAAAS